MALEVSNLNDLPLSWKRVTFRYSHSAHEALAVFLQQIESDGAVPIGGLYRWLGADDEGRGRDKLAFEVLSCTSSRIRRVPVLANEPFGARFVHGFHESPFCLRCHGRLANAEDFVHASEHEANTCVTDFVWLKPQVSAGYVEQVPEMEPRIGDFTVYKECLRLH